MSGVVLNPILERVFRSNPAYELALFDRLPLDRRELLKDLRLAPAWMHPIFRELAEEGP